MSEPASGAPYQALSVDDDQTSAASANPTDDDVDNRPVSPRRNDIWNQVGRYHVVRFQRS